MDSLPDSSSSPLSSGPPSLPPILPSSGSPIFASVDLPPSLDANQGIDEAPTEASIDGAQLSTSTSASPAISSLTLVTGLERQQPRIPIPIVSGESVSFAYAASDPNPSDELNTTLTSPTPQSNDISTGVAAVGRPLPPELAGAEIILGPDASFVETTSAQCAIELKRRYDALLGVGPALRSPFAITAFVGQHGGERFRVGHRAMTAPGAFAAQAEDNLVLSKYPPSQAHYSSKSPQSSKSKSITKSPASSSKSPTTSPRPSHHQQSQSYSRASKTKRHSRSRISINALLGTAPSSSSGSSSQPRKLKKPRSNPDLSTSSHGSVVSEHGFWGAGHANHLLFSAGAYAGGRMHSLSVTAADMPRVMGHNLGSTSATYLYGAGSSRDGVSTQSHMGDAKKKGDTFGEVMGWGSMPNTASTSTTHSGGTGAFGWNGGGASAPSTSYSPQKSHSLFFERTSSSGSEGVRDDKAHVAFPAFVARPFGSGVNFESPTPKPFSPNLNGLGIGGLKAPRHLREMQSFESGLTAIPTSSAAPASRGEDKMKLAELDLGGDLGLGEEIDFGDVAEMTAGEIRVAAGIGRDRELERQRSAIRLRDRDRDVTATPENWKSSEGVTPIADSGLESESNTGPSIGGPDTPSPTGSSRDISAPTSESESSSSHGQSPDPFSAPALSTPTGGTSDTSVPKLSFLVSLDNEEARRSSADPLGDGSEASTSSSPATPSLQNSEQTHDPLSSVLSRYTIYPTETFDVLQTYRGLPILDLLDDGFSAPESTPVKLSSSDTPGAAPKDDPRFVIWGELVSSSDAGDNHSRDNASVSHDSLSSGAGPSVAGKSHKGKTRSTDAPAPSLRVSSGNLSGMASNMALSISDDGIEKPRILLAATIERWLAQLTSELDYDELLNFFLTYRTYVSGVDLARLLIGRFCWALGRPTNVDAVASTASNGKAKADESTDHDELVRRIVRVRTFVAFRYWIHTFFAVDFVPNMELRLLVAGWLNDMSRDLAEAEMREKERIRSQGGNIKSSVPSRASDGLSIVKKLKKVAKECVRTYTRNNPSTLSKTSSISRPKSQAHPDSKTESTGSETKAKEHILGEKFAEATRKLTVDDGDSDLDLDFLPDDSSSCYPYANGPLSNIHLVGALGSTINLSPSGPSSIPLSSLSILQRTDFAPGPEEGRMAASGSLANTSLAQTATNLPIHHSTFSRVLVKTIGRLGRWKRTLNSGSGGISLSRAATTGGLGGRTSSAGLAGRMVGGCADVSAFDLELTVDARDLLSVNGGVDSYLRLIESQQTPRKQGSKATVVPATSLPSLKSPLKRSFSSRPSTSSGAEMPSGSTSRSMNDSTPISSPTRSLKTPISVSIPPTGKVSTSVEALSASPAASIPLELPPEYPTPGQHSDRISIAETMSEEDYGVTTSVHEVNESLVNLGDDGHYEGRAERSDQMPRRASRVSLARTSSTDSFGEPLSGNRASARFPAFRSPWQFDVVSIDELDSDNSSEEFTRIDGSGPAAPPGLRRPPRRLPLRRDFEFVQRPETVSSMGIISRSSVVSATSSASASAASSTSTNSAAGGLGGNIQQWQMNALVDSLTDDEEVGDVEDALKRLEGQISPEKQMEKASKVDGWVKTIRERLAAGDYSDEAPRFSDDESDEDEEQREADYGTFELEAESSQESDNSVEGKTGKDDSIKTPIIPQPNHLTSPPRTGDAKPAPEDAVPLEILQSRLSSDIPPMSSRPGPPLVSKFANNPSEGQPKTHRSFILMHRADELAQHFAMIDRELFMTIRFEELLSEDWMYCEEVNTLDWAQFLKDRARWKAENRCPEKTSALGAVRARFNLMVNFTVSEIVLTQPADRPLVFARFLKIAWKSYQRSSFNTLVAIVTGLRSEWVTRAMRKSMGRLTLWETRMFHDFKLYTANVDNFKHIRSSVDSIVDPKPVETASHAPASVVSGGGPDGSGRSRAGTSGEKSGMVSSVCIPFIGIYLSQLHQYNLLPAFIDPTSPNESVSIDSETSNLSTPAHPEVFGALAPLPTFMHLEPLINVQKQRLIAAVIKSLVAGQHLASRMLFPVDKKLFNKCLRLRALDEETLGRALAMLPE